MPTYTLKDIKTQEEHDVNCSYEELQQMIDSQPNLIKVLSTPGFVSSTQSHANSNTSDGWKEHLGRIKKASGRNNTIKL
jgi:hypothetical protein